MADAEQKQAQPAPGLILAAIALVFFVGFIVKRCVLGL